MYGTPTPLRYAVLVIFLVALYAAFASWLVRTRRVSPFSALGRVLRGTSEPLIRPVETRVVRAGGNPVHAGWWLVVGVAVAGILVLGVVGWVAQSVAAMGGAAQRGGREIAALAVDMTYRVMIIALIVRVVGQWFGVGRYRPWMRPVYWLTDWIVNPIARVLPPFGAFDFSPLVAWLALALLRAFVMVVFLGR